MIEGLYPRSSDASDEKSVTSNEGSLFSKPNWWNITKSLESSFHQGAKSDIILVDVINPV